MGPIDWGNMSLAVAALFGVVGLGAYFGMSVSSMKPPRHEPRMEEPQLRVFWPGRVRR